MKIHMEIEIEPEEMRRLIGLPDAQPFWDAVNKRIAEGDTEFLAQILKTTLQETAKSTEILGRIMKNVPFMRERGKDNAGKNEEEKTATSDGEAIAKKARPKRKRSASSSKSSD